MANQHNNEEHKEQWVEVAVVTSVGTYPANGYSKVPAHQKVEDDLKNAARELKITNTEDWIARVGEKQIDVDQTYIENKLVGQVFINWGPRGFTIFVNNNPFITYEHKLTGAQIKTLAGVPADYELFEVKGDQTVPVGNDQEVHIHEGMHFRAIPAGTFGKDGIAS